MSWRGLEGLGSLSRRIDNSRLVREVDPHSNRRLWSLLLLIGALVSGVVLYAWPQIEAYRTGLEALQLQGERENLIELNRKLRLEKAALEDLERIETIAMRDLGFILPPPERVVIVELPPQPDETQMATALESAGGARN